MKIGRATYTHDVVHHVEIWLKSRASSQDAAIMNKYMRCEERGDDVLLLGVKKEVRKELNRELKRDAKPKDAAAFEETVRALFSSSHREVRMTGAEMCRFWPKEFWGVQYLDLYEDLIRGGGWWDLVDIVAAGVVPRVLAQEREVVTARVLPWIDDDNFWIRRAAILSQLWSKDAADLDLLFRFSRERMHEKEFFVRKAIGWALREASKSFPDDVMRFLLDNKDDLSGLSFREGAKILVRDGRM